VTLYSTTATLSLSRKQLDLVQQGQIADRFARASELFAKDDTRLGAIFSLESIALDSSRDHPWPVIEVLTAFIRKASDWKWVQNRDVQEPRPEIDAIVTVLRRRNIETEKNQSVEYNEQDSLRRRLLLLR